MSCRLRLAAPAALGVPFVLAACAGGSDGGSFLPASDRETTSASAPSSVRSAPRSEVVFGDALPDGARAHLALSLRLADEAGVGALLGDLQNPASPRYHAWLTPEEYGERFGLPEAEYAQIMSWLESGGFAVTSYPNRLFVEAEGTVLGVRHLLRVQTRWASRNGAAFRSHTEDVWLPPDIAPHIARIGGLDTRVHLRHRLNLVYMGQATQALGGSDIRLLYDIPGGAAATGLTTVVLATQEGTQDGAEGNPHAPLILPSLPAIKAYFTTLSSATAGYSPIALPNPNDDFDSAGANEEYQIDVEMQSVGASDAKNIDLVLAPASEVFTTGAEYVANSLSFATSVSTSLGDCEIEEMSEDSGPTTPGSEAYVFRQAIQQGLAEGQTWFAASGDSGADDCNDQYSGQHDGFGGGNATVDFPCSIPEMLCVGGTQFANEGPSTWASSGALTGYQTEAAWNEGLVGGAGGGGQSLYYPKPSWQEALGPTPTDSARDVPDIAIVAATAGPGVAVYDCGSGQDPWSCAGENSGVGSVDIFGGTSIGSPLVAGIFARMSSQLSCRFGDVHPALYALGLRLKADGGAGPFHDVTTGNNSYTDPADASISGYSAGPGYDLATGWGSLDVAKLIASWPPCMAGGGALADGGIVPGADSGVRVPTAPADAGDAGGPHAAAAETKAGCSCVTAGGEGARAGWARLGAAAPHDPSAPPAPAAPHLMRRLPRILSQSGRTFSKAFGGPSQVST